MEGNDWDLFAVVRRGCRELPSSMSNQVVDPFSFSASLLPLEAGSRFLNDSVGRGSGFEELEELLKPYFSKPYQQQHQPQLQPSSSGLPALTASVEPTVRAPPRPPRRGRKNQQKKVVCQVPADNLSNDMWAWRKYGQKPIKGSPYPRGYYRCSSSKGCLARKQMERSRTDPGMFTITYTAEHNHPVPTHRNSLAGSTRHKLSSPPATELSPVTASTSTEDDEDEEEDDGMLMVEDMELLGEDDFVIVGEQSSNSTASASTTAINLSNFSNDDDLDRFLPQPWLAANATSNAAAAAGGN